MKALARFGIVIVTYNSEAHIGACLDSCLERIPAQSVEIVVIDNQSRDQTCSEVLKRPGVRLIPNQTNRGFAAAVNQGFRLLETSHILLLNPDVRLMTGVEPLLDCCRSQAVAAAGARLVDEQGRFQAGFAVRRFPGPSALICEVLGVNRIWPGNRLNRAYRCLNFDCERRMEVEQPAGALLMIRRDTWKKIGGFDEAFWPLWFEDVDFLQRARTAGHQVVYEPSVTAVHKGGHSVGSVPWGDIQVCWYGNLLRYACKHFSMPGVRGVSVAVILGFTARAVLRMFRERSLKPLGICVKVVRLAVSVLVSRPEVVTALPILD